MMRSAADGLHARGVAAGDIYLSMERNMQCAIGHCGHCQIGGLFVCRDGPVFAWPEVRPLPDRDPREESHSHQWGPHGNAYRKTQDARHQIPLPACPGSQGQPPETRLDGG